MTLSMKLGGAWKEAQSLHVKIAGEWKDVSTLYSKKDGAWVTVYSSGALITFMNYPYPIPVAAGWKYSTDKTNWTTVETDGEINTNGSTFTGYVKAKSITLNEYYTEHTPEGVDVTTVSPISSYRDNAGAFSNSGKGYYCGGGVNSYVKSVDVYDSDGSRTTGTSLSVARGFFTSFSNAGKGYVCGGRGSSVQSVVDIYDESGNRSTGTSLSVARVNLCSFVNGSKAYVCGGNNGSSNTNVVDVYDESGNLTSGTPLSAARVWSVTFVNDGTGYVCGGKDTSGKYTKVDVYDSEGVRTTGADCTSDCYSTYSRTLSFANKGYIMGIVQGYYVPRETIDVYDSSGNKTTGTPLSVARSSMSTFPMGSKGCVCGGGNVNQAIPYTVIDIYDESGNVTVGGDLSTARYINYYFMIGSKGFICGGKVSNSYTLTETVDLIQESYSTKLPITEGSKYTLNGESGVADISKVMEFDTKVSGTIKYKKGDMSPGVRVTVVDESGNVVSGASITIEGA